MPPRDPPCGRATSAPPTRRRPAPRAQPEAALGGPARARARRVGPFRRRREPARTPRLVSPGGPAPGTGGPPGAFSDRGRGRGALSGHGRFRRGRVCGSGAVRRGRLARSRLPSPRGPSAGRGSCPRATGTPIARSPGRGRFHRRRPRRSRSVRRRDRHPRRGCPDLRRGRRGSRWTRRSRRR